MRWGSRAAGPRGNERLLWAGLEEAVADKWEKMREVTV
jgi:hypothetical protein